MAGLGSVPILWEFYLQSALKGVLVTMFAVIHSFNGFPSVVRAFRFAEQVQTATD